MPTWKDAIAMAKALPDVEVSTWYSTPGLKVAGKGFARLRTEAEGGLVLMCTLEEKEEMLASGDAAYYTTPHYDGYGAILVDLKKVHADALRDLILQSWRLVSAASRAAGGSRRRPAADRPKRRPR